MFINLNGNILPLRLYKIQLLTTYVNKKVNAYK